MISSLTSDSVVEFQGADLALEVRKARMSDIAPAREQSQAAAQTGEGAQRVLIAENIGRSGAELCSGHWEAERRR